jgi:hypothetical protein
VLAILAAALLPATADARWQTTWLISKDRNGGIPNGPSSHGVISGDKRYARLIASQSEASDLVGGDRNGHSDIFAIRRAGSFSNDGEPWRPGKTQLVSRGRGGKPANGPSFAPSVDGNFYVPPKCIAFLSAASNLVKNDRNGKVDAFLVRRGELRRVSYVNGHQAHHDVTHVAVSGDCTRTAFVMDGRLFVRKAGRTMNIKAKPNAADPSFGVGEHNRLVFGAKGGVYLLEEMSRHPRKVASGRNPGFNDVKRNVVAYEAKRGEHWQIAYRDLGHDERVVSRYDGELGNDDSLKPVIANSGYYIGFETHASNLGTRADRHRKDQNGTHDTYLYTGVRNLTLVESVDPNQYGVPLPGGGKNPSISFYSNYFMFDSPAPLGRERGEHQVFMRYLGGK